MKNKPRISIIVPVRNEEEVIEKFIYALVNACRKIGLSFEIILVENGSTDKTTEIIRQNSFRTKEIRTAYLPYPGYGIALLQGIKMAKGKYFVIFNADYWDERFLDLTKADLLGYDIISGSKLLPGSKDSRPLNRRAITRIFNLFLKIFLKYPGTDTHGIKVMRRKTVMPVINNCFTRSGIIDSEIMIRAYRSNLKILELPVSIEEIRPQRFTFRRVVQTPVDMWNLYKALL